MYNNNFNAEIQKKLSSVVLSIQGDLINKTVFMFFDVASKMEPTKFIFIDCRHLRFIDGTGLQALSILIQQMQKMNKIVKLKNLNGQPKNLFHFLNLHSKLVAKQKIKKSFNLFKWTPAENFK